MKLSKLQRSFSLLIVITLLFSCSEDDDQTITTTVETAARTQDLILDWNTVWLELDRYATGMRPNATARSLAYIHLAAYETAVVDMNGYTSNTSRLQGLTIDSDQRDDSINLDIALNKCYAIVLDHFVYNISDELSSRIGDLENTKEALLSEGVSESIITASKNWGNYVAQQIITYSQSDTEAEQQILEPQPTSYEPPVGEGFWTYSADEERGLFPYWSSVRTFVISPEQTSSVVPIPYNATVGSDYYNQMNEVYEVNNEAKAQDNEDLWIAEFWSDDVEGLMMSPPGRQISIANQLIAQYDLEYEEALALLLKLGFSLNDAAVSTWADKYEYMVMRPNVYIHEFIDTEYQTNLFRLIDWPNPTFPGYPSGHSCFASAAAGVFIDQFGDGVDFTDRTHEGRTEFRGTPRQFDSFSEMAHENGFSRIPLGVHIRMDCEEGLRLGYEISDAVNSFDILQ